MTGPETPRPDGDQTGEETKESARDYTDAREGKEQGEAEQRIYQAAATFARLGFEGAAVELATNFKPDEYDRVRRALARRLGIRTATLDRAYDQARGRGNEQDQNGKGQGQALTLEDPDLWPEEVDGGALAEKIAATLESYVLLPQGAALVIAFWVLHTHCFDLFYHTPRLNPTAPQKGCGKSTLLDVLEPMLPRPLHLDNLSTAVFFRLADQHAPCFLIDEYDKFLKGNEELLGALNAGHKRGGQFARCEGDSNEVRLFGVFCPVMLAGIGALPAGTLTDRSIIIHMTRAREDEIPKRFDGRFTDAERALSEKAARWVNDHRTQLSIVDPPLPKGLYNRKADNWRPLFSIAGVLGGDWPAKLTEAALSVIGSEEPEETLAIQMLIDIRDLFQERKTDRLRSQDLAESLGKMEDRPWFQFRRTGKPITQNAVARLLNPFGVHPKQIRFDEGNKKGYELEFFAEVFSRFLEEGIQTDTPIQNNNDAGFSDFQTDTLDDDISVTDPRKVNNDAGCIGVSDWEGGVKGKGEDPKPKGWEIQI